MTNKKIHNWIFSPVQHIQALFETRKVCMWWSLLYRGSGAKHFLQNQQLYLLWYSASRWLRGKCGGRRPKASSKWIRRVLTWFNFSYNVLIVFIKLRANCPLADEPSPGRGNLLTELCVGLSWLPDPPKPLPRLELELRLRRSTPQSMVVVKSDQSKGGN